MDQSNEDFSPKNEEYITVLYAEYLVGTTSPGLLQRALWEGRIYRGESYLDNVFRIAKYYNTQCWDEK